ncbi:MAG: MotA/TolQ/ExbB proton channel family protein [Endomicrobium sp.]|uniref:MotA/TolQ/ExbB proton channel family protein n=1 Tax=Candidatus Endomicrobiellum pyrsonymphae TaxID=1408203 RepID=UPI003577F638|nr:MotA/TolQ/ExbB proton channel family protein [Endomicrobium sp.]
MFDGKNFIEILNMGGWALYVLFAASVLSIAVICLKSVEFWRKSKVKRKDFIRELIKKIREENIDKAVDYCEEVNSPMGPVAGAGLVSFKEKEGHLGEAMEREVMIQTVKLENFVTILGTLGSIAVYVGLFGTVLGIIGAFHDISAVGSGGITVVIGGVSEALIATAAGLSVAIPATVAYNFFSKSIDKFVVDMEYCASSVEEALKGMRKK